jgi:hypothetical protein
MKVDELCVCTKFYRNYGYEPSSKVFDKLEKDLLEYIHSIGKKELYSIMMYFDQTKKGSKLLWTKFE